MQDKVLKCFAEETADGWEAICIDLDISVQGDSLQEVVRDLDDSILVYLQSVMGLPEMDRERLLNRRTPIQQRAQLALRYFSYSVFGRGTRRARHDFMPPPDACPA